MSSLLHRLSKTIQRRLVTPGRIKDLLNQADKASRAAGKATQKALSISSTPDEKAWMNRIEARRATLLARTDAVPVPDYGAGAPTDTRSETEMLSGIMTNEVVGEACANYSKDPLFASLLFHYIREFKPTRGVELGTCLGISAAYQSAAMELNGDGRLVTLEGSTSFGEIARQGLEELGLSKRCEVILGRFVDTLPGVIQQLGQIDYAFIDGHHDEQATIQYFEQLLPHLAPSALLVFDDIAWSDGMMRAWKHLCARSEISSWVDYGKVGVCWTGHDRVPGCAIVI